VYYYAILGVLTPWEKVVRFSRPKDIIGRYYAITPRTRLRMLDLRFLSSECAYYYAVNGIFTPSQRVVCFSDITNTIVISARFDAIFYERLR